MSGGMREVQCGVCINVSMEGSREWSITTLERRQFFSFHFSEDALCISLTGLLLAPY